MTTRKRDDFDFKAVGGKLITKGPGRGGYNFGWIPFEQRDRDQEAAAALALARMPRFRIEGKKEDDPKKVCLFDLWKHPAVAKALGFAYPGVHQITGSCVGAGGGNAIFSLLAADAIRRGEPERVAVPFWLLPYGRSRYYLGDRSPGEGSSGTTFAKAAREDGTIDAAGGDLPTYARTDGLVWGSKAEYAWSDGDAKQTMDRLPLSRMHIVETTAECRSADDVREAIRNYYPCTAASNWGGLMRCPTEGNPPVLLNRRSGSWSHQMSYHAWWDHPTLGELFWEQNQWGLTAHGTCPSGAPPGGYWKKKAEVDWVCRNGEVIAFSQYRGFPAQSFSWYI